MNYYFLLEDSQSFIKVLPKWLNYMGFRYIRVPDIKLVEENNYIMQSGHGVTQLITKVLFDTIDTIISNPGKIDYLIIILDSENLDGQERRKQVQDKINERYSTNQIEFEIEIFVCNHCFETWLLGAKGIYPSGIVDNDSFFYPYYTYYNISECDPENMLVPDNLNETIAKYHFHYLHELFRYKKIRYRKNNTIYVESEEYFNAIIDRIQTTLHLKSFYEFYEFFIRNIKNG